MEYVLVILINMTAMGPSFADKIEYKNRLDYEVALKNIRVEGFNIDSGDDFVAYCKPKKG